MSPKAKNMSALMLSFMPKMFAMISEKKSGNSARPETPTQKIDMITVSYMLSIFLLYAMNCLTINSKEMRGIII